MSKPDKKDTNPKDAIGCKKPPLSVVPMNVVFEIGLAMMEGMLKYGRHNYRVSGVRASIYFDALMRHIGAWWEGEDLDPDSGLNHVTKAIACLVVLRDAMMQGKLADDRPPRAKRGWMDTAKALCDDLLSRFPDPEAPFTIEDSENE